MTELRPYKFNFHAMASANEIELWAHSLDSAQSIADSMIAEVRRIEAKYSRYQSTSVVSEINRSAGIEQIELDSETVSLINFAKSCYEQSAGLFDITSGALRRVWDFKSQRVPSQREIEGVLRLVGFSQLEWQAPKLFLKMQEMELDFGGFGKEYAADRAAGVAIAKGIKSGLVNLGGDVRIIGPRPDKLPYRIGIKDPRNLDNVVEVVELYNGALATSGDYERYFEKEEKRYCHILNPKTGWPVVEFQSVTAVGRSCIEAGYWSTLGMLKGRSLKGEASSRAALAHDMHLKLLTISATTKEWI